MAGRTSSSPEPSRSFVSCKTQQEVDELWEKLSEGGSVQQCGWLKDKYGVSWQWTAAIELRSRKFSDTA